LHSPIADDDRVTEW